MQALQGVGVLVTRPEQQAGPLCRLVESHGAIAVRFPVMEIRPVEVPRAKSALLRPAAAFDLIVFTSANAVKFGAPLLDAAGATVAAIGPATARALDQVGLRATVTPDTVDSEGLLRHPQLARGPGQRVLIVKGMQGRELLQQQFVERGAEVTVAEVYRRERIAHDAGDLAALAMTFARGAIDVITATSVEIAMSLSALPSSILMREFARVHWLVPSARVASAVRDLGMTAPILQAASAEDQDLLATMLRWRSSVSGA
jgi:uroporphyrinogen-III synthase